MRKDRHVTKTLFAAAVVGAGLMLGGCAPQYKNHGYIPPQEDLDKISIGQDTRDTVAQTVGVPASAGLLTNSGYYYVRSRRRAVGFLAPKEIEREVVAVSFNAQGVVENVERFGLERGNIITLDRRVTSSSVRDRSFIRQLLGNIGRFNPAGLAG
ncbi:outer membrane protein assembly factor BamE [Sulfitobacter sp.]|uniref:outer membrane protein assembly factor BamE n=1 Tax=Sulfitobacter sp. TaxID=1903071 RepID=UPI003F6B818D|tara:strand:+ start:742 stop:1206 length:465 start_codon:yes stop_codon:yes gene_type:complete